MLCRRRHPTGKTILVLENDKNAREAIGHLLERAGYDVERASDAEEAIRRAGRGASPEAADLWIADARDAAALSAHARSRRGSAPHVVLLEEPGTEPEGPARPAGAGEEEGAYAIVGRLEKPFHKRDVLHVVAESFGAFEAEGRPPSAR